MSSERYFQISNLEPVPEIRERLETKTAIIVSGLPGNVATLVAEAVESSGNYILLDIALSSSNHEGYYQAPFRRRHSLDDMDFSLVSSENRLFAKDQLHKTKKEYKSLIVVDYTCPDAVNSNAELYVEAGIPFVMGTTGGDRQKLMDLVKNSDINAVIDANMAGHVVLMKSLLEEAAQNFPRALSGWKLSITESHQSAKKDISGTAKAWLPKFEAIGAELDGSIECIRDPQKQVEMGIQNTQGHGYHWFTLTSPDNKATLQISTTVEGRSVYVDGTLMAIKFLEEKMRTSEKGRVYTMTDVLKSQKLN